MKKNPDELKFYSGPDDEDEDDDLDPDEQPKKQSRIISPALKSN